ncbi:DUF6415 family natural product biosynthesis protein [Streptomyces sp. SRF1]|uniref:DUF6415 family natural product biosynthesis protein n=1 Tax=Streptomyces sp. SRF1 TaxID=1549642 RepID=UPI0025B02BAF|nr:DUF6415 family natural product biosynthesis protein [Streptomyces sp. SRF1]MDN3061235.1 DUF6415 family natural product biosynthesis protein [Streptomyces sp. SRF1]
MSSKVIVVCGVGGLSRLEPEASTLLRVLHGLRDWDPLDGHQVLEDLANVLDNQAPAEHEFDELDRRLRVTVRQLANIALATDQRHQQVAELIEQANLLCSEARPRGYWKAVGQLRRLGWVTSGLLEHLPKVAARLESAA